MTSSRPTTCDLAEPPAELHWYELAKNDFGMTRRNEVLLVDLET